MEGDAQFTAGEAGCCHPGLSGGRPVDPNNAEVWAKLARIQTYSSALQTTDNAQRARLQEALASAEKAVELAPDDSFAHAIYSFALDWNASPYLINPDPEQQAQGQRLLTQAEQEANRALLLDNTNTLALAFYAEILVDQQKWTQAEINILQALERDPTLMDVHRVYAYVLESFGQYNQAIQEYDTAISIAPNLTFLHLRAGANYRRLAFGSPNEETATQLYEKSLEYFAKAASINEQLGVEDPIPYLSISKTYSQMGSSSSRRGTCRRRWNTGREIPISMVNWASFISKRAITKPRSFLSSAQPAAVREKIPAKGAALRRVRKTNRVLMFRDRFFHPVRSSITIPMDQCLQL
jgi:hypothetical protein